MKEKPKQEKKKQEQTKAIYDLQHITTDSRLYVDQECLEYFMKEVPIQKPVYQWTVFYTTTTSVMEELMLCYLHVFNEIYSLIMTK